MSNMMEKRSNMFKVIFITLNMLLPLPNGHSNKYFQFMCTIYFGGKFTLFKTRKRQAV